MQDLRFLKNEKNVTERARGELRPGEALFYSEKSYHSVGLGVFLMLLGGLVLGIAIPVILIIIGSEVKADEFWVAVAVCGLMSAIGLLMLHLGFYTGFTAAKNYHFITDQRLGLRGKSLWGKPLDRDILASSIEHIAVEEVRGKGSVVRRYISLKIKNEKNRVAFHPSNVDQGINFLSKMVKLHQTEESAKEIMTPKSGDFGRWIVALGIIIFLIFLPFAIFLPREAYSPLVDFNATPSEGLRINQHVTIDLGTVFNKFATIKINSSVKSGKYGRSTKRYSTTRVYYAIKTLDGKIMALAVNPELENEVSLRWRNTLIRSQGDGGAGELEPLQLRGVIYEMDKRIYNGRLISISTQTPPSESFHRYIHREKINFSINDERTSPLEPLYRHNAESDAELRLIEKELRNSEVFPFVLHVTGRNDSESITKMRAQAWGEAGLCAVLALIGAAMVIVRLVKRRKRV